MVSYIDLSSFGIYFFINKKSIYLKQMESIPYDKRSGKDFEKTFPIIGEWYRGI